MVQLEKEKGDWLKEKEELMEIVSFAGPSHTNNVATKNDDLVKSMSQISLKDGEIKGLKEQNQKLKQEVAQRSEKSEQVQKENDFLEEKISKLKSRIKGKGPL